MNIKKKGKPYGNAQNVLYEVVLYIFRFLGSYCLVKFILYIQIYETMLDETKTTTPPLIGYCVRV